MTRATGGTSASEKAMENVSRSTRSRVSSLRHPAQNHPGATQTSKAAGNARIRFASTLLPNTPIYSSAAQVSEVYCEEYVLLAGRI